MPSSELRAFGRISEYIEFTEGKTAGHFNFVLFAEAQVVVAWLVTMDTGVICGNWK
jgi:hypothetical protein